MATMTSSALSTDQEKMLGADLTRRSWIKLVAASLCKKVKMEEGAGLTAYFIRYKRMYVPLDPLSDDGNDPAASSFELEQVTVTLDEWGDLIRFTSRAKLTTKHPLMQQCMELLADNAARVMDREVQLVWLAGTNVYYGDTSVAARSDITAAMYMNDTLIHKVRSTMSNQGVSGRDGAVKEDAKQVEATGGVRSGNYVGVVSPFVAADIMQKGTSFGTWAAVATYANQSAMYNAEVGTWLNIRWVESNFLPSLTLFGNTTTAITTGNSFGAGTPTVTAVDGGGTLTSATTYFWKVTRIDLLRGFEEAISIEHSMASAAAGNNESFTFAFPATAGYAYNVYFGSSTGDANLKLNASHVAAGATATVTAVSSSTTTAPANINPLDSNLASIQTCYIVGAEACQWVGFYDIKVMVSKDESTVGNTLRRRREVGYTFFGKAMILDQTRLARLEVASQYA